MATLAELQAEENRLSAEFNRVQREFRASGGENNELATQREQLRAALAQIRAEIEQASNQSAATGVYEGQDRNSGLYRYKNPITGNSFLSDTAPTAEQQQASGITVEPPAQPAPPETAGESAAAAAPQGPTKAAQETVTQPETSNAGETDTGTNPPVVTTEQSQAVYYENDGTGSTNSAVPETYYENDGTPSTSAVVETGTSTNDDAANNSTTTKQTNVNAANNTSIKVTPQPNILDEYFSYTYSASLYLLKPDQYTRLINSKLE